MIYKTNEDEDPEHCNWEPPHCRSMTEPRGSEAGREKEVYILRLPGHLTRGQRKGNIYLYIYKLPREACEILHKGLNLIMLLSPYFV